MDQNNMAGVNPLQPEQPTSPAQPEPPVIQPTQPAEPPVSQPAPQPVQPTMQPVSPSPRPMPEIPTPVNPVFKPSGAAGVAGVGQLSATEAIMQPTPPPAPDPVEEELKAPLKPADPVPGSIGSAVSVPAGATPEIEPAGGAASTPSVAFNDPATMQDPGATQPAGPLPPKKKMDKKTLTIIAILAGMVVIALVAVLVMTMMG